MWTFNKDINKWFKKEDSISKYDFDLLKEESKNVRFYSKCFSGSVYLPLNDTENIYDILTDKKTANWFINTQGSIYAMGGNPTTYLSPITASNADTYYNKYLSEYGHTLKTLFTPDRLIDDSLENFYYVDIASTTDIIDIEAIDNTTMIDGVKLKEGQTILIKDNKTYVELSSTADPDDYFTSNYYKDETVGTITRYHYYNNTNGIYIFKDNKLTRSDVFDDYKRCIRYSVCVKEGVINSGKQFHLSRLRDGYYPTTKDKQPIEFTEKHNWLLRNKVDYNNIFEANYTDVLKHDKQEYSYDGITYSIPERTITIGEFGIILNTQARYTTTATIEYTTNAIYNKYKTNLKSICQTSKYYWICGEKSTLLKIQKHDFKITNIQLKDSVSNTSYKMTYDIRSISFYDDLNGVLVGEMNNIYITSDGGITWTRYYIDIFNDYNYNKVIYYNSSTIFICGDNGIFIRLINNNDEWYALKKKISQNEYTDSEIDLVDNINDMCIGDINPKISLSAYNSTGTDITGAKVLYGKYLFLSTDGNKIIIYDFINDNYGVTNAIVTTDNTYYLNINNNDYGDIKNICVVKNILYFNATDTKTDTDYLFSIKLNTFTQLNTFDSIEYEIQNTNTIYSTYNASKLYPCYTNRIYDYNNIELFICGNYSLKEKMYYVTKQFSDYTDIDKKLKSRMLIMDYDIASKVNFFTDDGDYRLPSTAYINTTDITYLSLQHIDTERNWIDYISDSQKAFEYYIAYTDEKKPYDDTSTVYPSTTFSISGVDTKDTILKTDITINSLYTNKLMPHTASTYYKSNVNIDTNVQHFKLYIKSDVLVYAIDPIMRDYYKVGDVLYLQSSVVDTYLMINKIIDNGGYVFLYMYNDFNDNIINDLCKDGCIITNLNNNIDINDLYNNFNRHIFSKGYSMTYSGSTISITSNFNTYTAYYNMQTNVITDKATTSMVYTTAFMRFGYSPSYNILDYLSNIDSTSFNPYKQFYAMPCYEKIPISKDVTTYTDTISFDYDGITYSTSDNYRNSNKLYFGKDLDFEYNSIFINTFIDINMTINGISYKNEKMLVMNKYEETDRYVIEFHKALNYPLGYANGTIDIVSRNTLQQISDDLSELNNIQKSKRSVDITWFNSNATSSITSYNNELLSKISTDSYTKILLSDSDIQTKISAILYVDYKHELSMNVVNLNDNYVIDIANTSKFTDDNNKDYPLISCKTTHNLSDNDGVVITFNGGQGSSEELNQSYMGYHNIKVIDDYDFIINTPYNNDVLVGVDSGEVIASKTDSFMGFEPVDLIDVGVDGKGKKAIELNTNNVLVSNKIYYLTDVDYNNYRYRLVDSLDIKQLSTNYSWILEAEISDAVIGVDLDNNKLLWYKGTWEFGRWYDGVWYSGAWLYGDWYGGTWNSMSIEDKKLSVKVNEKTTDDSQSLWYNGRWYDGTWNGGAWVNGRWYGGTHSNGKWNNGIWDNGEWIDGEWNGGAWVDGIWHKGTFSCDVNPSYWIDGKWYSGDFRNGLWYNGIFTNKEGQSYFGRGAFNSRNAIWESGSFINGEFWSGDTLDVNCSTPVCLCHKYSIFKTGDFVGVWYGGIAYDIDFRGGTWYGGIVEQIQPCRLSKINDNLLLFTFIGHFRFNENDTFFIVDDNNNQCDNIIGTTHNPVKYTIFKYTQKYDNTYGKITEVYTTNPYPSVFTPSLSNKYTSLRAVSTFNDVRWVTGIFTDGVFESGYVNDIIWYNGKFDAIWG